jgi:hypothetical protein
MSRWRYGGAISPPEKICNFDALRATLSHFNALKILISLDIFDLWFDLYFSHYSPLQFSRPVYSSKDIFFPTVFAVVYTRTDARINYTIFVHVCHLLS